MAEAAAVLGRTDEEKKYRQISEQVRAAICREYVDQDGRLNIRTQTAHVLALRFEVVEPEKRQVIVDDLMELLRENGMHLTCGFVGTAYLCKVLSEAGLSEAAYQVLFQKDFPSWLYEVDMGATTIWERWNSVLPDGKISGTGMNSLNHYAYGSIAQWMYEHMAGLRENEPGFKSFTICPEFTERFDFVDVNYRSPKGEIKVRWDHVAEDEGRSYRLSVKVPFDTTAQVCIPGERDVQILLPGEHTVSYRT